MKLAVRIVPGRPAALRCGRLRGEPEAADSIVGALMSPWQHRWRSDVALAWAGRMTGARYTVTDGPGGVTGPAV
jgi:hypothetical protein